MIHDRLERAPLYFGAHPGFRAAFEWLGAHAATAEAGMAVPVAGDRVVARPARYVPHAFDPERFEHHRRFVDVQYVAEGEEVVRVGDAAEMRRVGAFDEAADVGFLAGEGEPVRLRAGEFLVLWPHEAHQPGIAPGPEPAGVRKVVVKVALP